MTDRGSPRHPEAIPSRIVIVDDNPDDRQLEARLLREAITDLEIIEVADAATWATVLGAGHFDLVVTDYHLNWSDGLRVLREVRARYPDRPVVMVTGTGTEELAVEAMKAGLEDYVLKEHGRIQRLPRIVLSALERSRGHALDRSTRMQLEREVHERSLVTEALQRIHAGQDPQETAAIVCREIQETLGFDIAAIVWLLGDSLVVLGIEGPVEAPLRVGGAFSPGLSLEYVERARSGEWIDDWFDESVEDTPFRRAWRQAGFSVANFVPLRRNGEIVGLLGGASSNRWSLEEMSRRLPSLVEFAAIAAALIEPAMSARRAAVAGVSEIRSIIAAQAFRPVFQPIVGLASRIVGGFEALTRFDDKVPPNSHFAAARAAGVGPELEAATLETAIQAAEQLPPWAFLSLNVSAELVLSEQGIEHLIARTDRQIVLELTEHEEGIDGGAFTARARRFGDRVRLAVDDAGAGYAGLRRVLEIRPEFVKLDIGLVRGVDKDPAREAMIAGMVHFARETECSLIAEGIEYDAERRVLKALGVSFGQGYLLGRPQPAGHWAKNVLRGAK